jgi:hypothetical protein
MSFDAYVVAFGLSRLLGELHLVETNAAYLVLVVISIVDTWLLYRFFAGLQPEYVPRVDPESQVVAERRGA